MAPSGSSPANPLDLVQQEPAVGSNNEDIQLSRPAVTTDKDDYAPGETATFTATGFAPGSTLSFAVADDPTDPGDDGDADVYPSFEVTDGGDGDLDGEENGQVVTTWFVPTDNNGTGTGIPDAANATLNLTVTGSGTDGVIGTADDQVAATTFTDSALPAGAPSIALLKEYLIIGMAPSSWGEAVTIGSSQEIGANRQTLSGDPYPGLNVSPVLPVISPAYSSPNSPDLRDVFFPDPLNPQNTSLNRWLWNPNPNATNGPGENHYLPGAAPLFRGVDWSGDVAVTSATGTFSLQNINVFGQFGFRATNQSAPVDISNSRYFDAQSPTPLTGISMDSLDDSLPSPDSPTQGWDGGFNHNPLLDELRTWRTYIRGLSRDAFFDSGNSGPDARDLVNRNTINSGGVVSATQGKLVYDVNGLDINNDGIATIDIAFDGSDFDVNNSDWIITDSDLTNGTPFVIFRIRGGANMVISDSSIMVSDALKCDNGMAVLFVKAHPDEEFESDSGSTDAVFNADNLVANGIGFWDLNTIGDANLDTDYGRPTDRSVYVGGVDFPTVDYVKRNEQVNYTQFSNNNGQGCAQFIAPSVYMQNVRWTQCAPCDPIALDFGDLPDSSAGTGPGDYQTLDANSGPSHVITDGLQLGDAIDAEADGQTSADALGDLISHEAPQALALGL
jgi:hypothetical protein